MFRILPFLAPTHSYRHDILLYVIPHRIPGLELSLILLLLRNEAHFTIINIFICVFKQDQDVVSTKM